MSGASSVASGRLISAQSAQDEIYRAIAMLMGSGRRWSVKDVAIGTDPTGEAEEVRKRARRLQSYIAGSPEDRRTPPSDELLVLCQFFGPQFTSKVLSAIGQGARHLEPLPQDPAKVIEILGTGFTRFAILGSDGIYCHIDQGDLEQTADQMIQVLEPFSSWRHG